MPTISAPSSPSRTSISDCTPLHDDFTTCKDDAFAVVTADFDDFCTPTISLGIDPGGSNKASFCACHLSSSVPPLPEYALLT